MTIYTGKVELGTGLKTAQMQIAADELDVPLDRDRPRHVGHVADARPGHDVRQPVAEDAASAGALRRGCAEARQALLEMAAERLGVPANSSP